MGNPEFRGLAANTHPAAGPVNPAIARAKLTMAVKIRIHRFKDPVGRSLDTALDEIIRFSYFRYPGSGNDFFKGIRQGHQDIACDQACLADRFRREIARKAVDMNPRQAAS